MAQSSPIPSTNCEAEPGLALWRSSALRQSLATISISLFTGLTDISLTNVSAPIRKILTRLDLTAPFRFCDNRLAVLKWLFVRAAEVTTTGYEGLLRSFLFLGPKEVRRTMIRRRCSERKRCC